MRRTWASFELSTRPNVYSVHGLGAAGVSFTMRRQGLTLDSALRWRGQHCLITAIRPLGRLYLTAGPLVEVDGVEWPVLTAYELDPHRNEYILGREVDL